MRRFFLGACILMWFCGIELWAGNWGAYFDWGANLKYGEIVGALISIWGMKLK